VHNRKLTNLPSAPKTHLVWHSRHPQPLRAFTLIETCVVVGVLAVVLALALPALGRLRAEAKAAATLQRISTINGALSIYASTFRDHVPVFLPPIEAYAHRDPVFVGEVYGRVFGGFWFDHAFLYHIAFSPPLPMESLLAPNSDWTRPEVTQGVRSTRNTTFWLSATLYADPEYWQRFGQRGALQWRPQRLSSVRFPSHKGLLHQVHNHSDPGLRPNQSVPLWPGVRGAVAWGDMSATMPYQRDLTTGVPNYFDHWQTMPPSFLADGWPVHQTEWGVWGRDRP
jgi:type II secretory pathway pseudopilin PulG